MAIIDLVKNYKTFRRYDGEFGVEIETETKEPYVVPTFAYWAVHDDGSLRDFGKEYILKQPLRYEKEIPEALREFGERTKSIKFLKDTPTTSVHVHVNMLNESFQTMGNFLTLYTLFENLLVRYAGEDRRSNLFCLPICDAEDTYKNIVKMFEGVELKNYKALFLQENMVKYAALNLSSFSNFGSLEIRLLKGETEPEAIQIWIDMIYSLLSYARKDITPKEIMVQWRDRQVKFIDDVFNKSAKYLHRKDEISLLEQNIWYAGSVAYSVKGDWRNLDIVKQSAIFKPKQKDLDTMAVKLFKVPFGELDPAQADYVMANLRRKLEGGNDRWIPEPVIRDVPLRARRVNMPANEANFFFDPRGGREAGAGEQPEIGDDAIGIRDR